MIAFIDDHHDVHGVEPICEVLPIAPSTYRAHAAARRDPEKSSARAKRDAGLREKIRRVYDENFQVYGARKIWRQLNREGESLARCTVERLMRGMGLQGAVRGKPVKTTVSDKAAPCPQDKVNRQFQAPRPNAPWVSDFTYVATWAGFVYVAFAFARIGAVVGMRVEDYYPNGKRWWVRLHEKGGKRHEMPAHHNLEAYLDAYIEAAGIREGGKAPLFRSAVGRTGALTDKPMNRVDAWRMIQRRSAELGMRVKIGCHTFRATGITAYLEAGGTLENAQAMAAHERTRTTSSMTARAMRLRSMRSNGLRFSG